MKHARQPKRGAAQAAPEPNEAPVAEASGPAIFQMIPLDRIQRSPLNRDTFDDEKFRELVASVRQLGVLQPIMVRPLHRGPGLEALPPWEIVMGERRWRAAGEVGLAEIPATVRDLDDRAAEQLRLTENLQREDLRPLDEARGFRRLLDMGWAVDDLVEKLNRSRSAIYARLKLLDLAPSVQRHVETGKMPASHAEAIAALPDRDAQERVALAVMDPEDWDRDEETGILPFREVKELVGTEARKAHNAIAYASKRAEFEASGWRVLTDEECAKVWPYDSDYPGGQKYERLSDTCYDVSPVRPWSKLLKKSQLPAPVLGRTSLMAPVEVYVRAELVEAAKAAGAKFRVDRPGNDKAAQARKREHARRRREAWKEANRALVAAVERAGEGKEFLGFVLDYVLDRCCNREKLAAAAEAREIAVPKKGSAADALREADLNAKQLRGLIVQLIATKWEPYDFAANRKWDRGFVAACDRFGAEIGDVQTSGDEGEGE
jgi:ParB/RepB/Spo0J family partition protein